MQNHKHLIVANWKMNPSSKEEAKRIINSTKKIAKELKRTEVVICPPFPFIDFVKPDDKKVFSGVQNVFYVPVGTFTGEVSSEMIRAFGAKYSIVGHSERRHLGETDDIVSKKANASLMAGLKTIICVGEETRDNSGDYLNFLRNQIKNSLANVKKKFLFDLIIAYEPVWAISKSTVAGQAMNFNEVHEANIFIKKTLVEIFGKDWVSGVRILYGGSVNFENAENIIKEAKVDGFLVGRESLDIETFPKLLKSVDGIQS